MFDQDKDNLDHMHISEIRPLILIALYLMALFSPVSSAIDILKLPAPQSGFDKKRAHKQEVIIRALDITTPKYGAYEIQLSNKSIVKGRALKMMEDGDFINFYIGIANQEWNQKAIPIKIPLRFGVNSYRLLLVNKHDLPKFNKVHTLEDLKKLRVGLGRDWTITEVFRVNGFRTVESSNFEGTFLMLPHHRFDYIPRGINEIFDELQQRKEILNDVVVEPRLALEIKLSTYAYVSPKYPRLAKRIEAGLRLMLANGELRQLFDKYYLEDIKHADMHNRRVIKINNPLFVDKELLDDPKYWLTPNSL